MDYKAKYDEAFNYVIALQQAIEHHCHNELIPEDIALKCPHHAGMLNRHLTTQYSRANGGKP